MFTKPCTKCRAEKPLTEFYKQSRTKDALSYYCKDCLKSMMRDLHKRKYPQRREQMIENVRAWRLRHKN